MLMFFLFQIKNNSIVNITINPDKDKEVTFLLSDFASNVKYIKLQTDETCMVAQIFKLLIDGENIFIESQYGVDSRLLRFTSEGDFVNEIGLPGRGPGEYSAVLDFTLNKSKKIIYILDTMGKILLYDYSGTYFNTIKLDSRPSNLLFYNDALFLFSAWPDYYLNKGYGIEIKQLSENKKDIYLLNRKQIKFQREQGVIIYPNYFYGINANKSISFLEAKFDTLYNIDSKYNIQPKMVLNLINKVPRDLLTTNDYINARKTHNTYFNFIEVNNYIFFTLITAKLTTYFYLLNKSSGEVLKHNVTADKHYIFNDIDGGLSFKPQGLADEGVLYSSIDCYSLKDHLTKNYSKNVKLKNPAEKENLKKLVKNSDLSDNPIIMLVILK